MQSHRPTEHCCACWRYTDDQALQRDALHEAVAVLVNGSTLCVEKSDAFNAADKYITAYFNRHSEPRMPRL